MQSNCINVFIDLRSKKLKRELREYKEIFSCQINDDRTILAASQICWRQSIDRVNVIEDGGIFKSKQQEHNYIDLAALPVLFQRS